MRITYENDYGKLILYYHHRTELLCEKTVQFPSDDGITTTLFLFCLSLLFYDSYKATKE